MPSNRICIIDDNEAVCQSLKFLLESFYDINVQAYSSPIAFLEEFSPEWRGCLFIDLFMPSLSGIDVMKELTNRHCKMKIIVISGHGAAEVSKQAMNAGAYAFISKPLDVENLIKHASEILQMNP